MQKCSILIRELRGATYQQQLDACEAEAKRLGLKIANVFDASVATARDEWLEQIKRRKEVGMVSHLEVIGATRDECKSPTADFGGAIADALVGSKYLVEASSGITSRDGKKWRDAVTNAGAIITSGRIFAKRVAAGRETKQWAKALPNTVARWKSPAMKAQREQLASTWRDPLYSNDQKAFAALPEHVQQQFGSASTARRVFGGRRPGSKSAGGRPRKS